MNTQINLNLGDCVEAMREMPDNAYELAIVDPPYGIGLGFSDAHKQARGGEKGKGHKQKDWNKSTPSAEYFSELLRVSKRHIIWGCNYYLNAMSTFGVGRIVHNKLPTPFIASTYSHADIAATNCQNRITMFTMQWSGNVQNGKMNTRNENSPFEGLEKRIHPTQKPVNLYRWLLENYAKEGDKILDTHLGSGSIAIACHDGGFALDAWEIDAEYHKLATERFNTHIKQLRLL